MLIQRTPRGSGLSDKPALISIVAVTPPVSADSADGSSNRSALAATQKNQRKRWLSGHRFDLVQQSESKVELVGIGFD